MHKEKSVVYIGGTGRCGTNVLKDLMSTASNAVSLPFETRFTIDPDGVVSLYEALCRHDFYRANSAIKRFSEFMRRVSRRSILDKISLWGEKKLRSLGVNATLRSYAGWELAKHFNNIDYETERLLDRIAQNHFKGYWPGEGGLAAGRCVVPIQNEEYIISILSEYISSIYDNFLDINNADVYVDDNTFNLLHMDSLAALRMKSFFVHSIRDPRNVVLSMLKQRWCPSDIEGAVQFYKYLMDKIIENERKVDPSLIFRFKIEKLSPVFFEDVCSFLYDLKLDFDEAAVSLFLDDQAGGVVNNWRQVRPDVQNDLNTRLGYYINLFGYENY